MRSVRQSLTFLAQNGDAYKPPLVTPPTYPTIVMGTTTAEREQPCAENTVDATYWTTANHGQRITVKIGAAAFNEYVYAKIDDPDKGLNDVIIQDLYDCVMDCFAQISQSKIDSKLASFNDGIDPSKMLAVYT